MASLLGFRSASILLSVKPLVTCGGDLRQLLKREGVFGGPRHVRKLLGQLAAVFFLVGWAVAGPGGGFLFAAGPLAYSAHAPKDKHICRLLLPSVKFGTKPALGQTFAPTFAPPYPRAY